MKEDTSILDENTSLHSAAFVFEHEKRERFWAFMRLSGLISTSPTQLNMDFGDFPLIVEVSAQTEDGTLISYHRAGDSQKFYVYIQGKSVNCASMLRSLQDHEDFGGVEALIDVLLMIKNVAEKLPGGGVFDLFVGISIEVKDFFTRPVSEKPDGDSLFNDLVSYMEGVSNDSGRVMSTICSALLESEPHQEACEFFFKWLGSQSCEDNQEFLLRQLIELNSLLRASDKKLMPTQDTYHRTGVVKTSLVPLMPRKVPLPKPSYSRQSLLLLCGCFPSLVGIEDISDSIKESAENIDFTVEFKDSELVLQYVDASKYPCTSFISVDEMESVYTILLGVLKWVDEAVHSELEKPNHTSSFSSSAEALRLSFFQQRLLFVLFNDLVKKPNINLSAALGDDLYNVPDVMSVFSVISEVYSNEENRHCLNPLIGYHYLNPLAHIDLTSLATLAPEEIFVNFIAAFMHLVSRESLFYGLDKQESLKKKQMLFQFSEFIVAGADFISRAHAFATNEKKLWGEFFTIQEMVLFGQDQLSQVPSNLWRSLLPDFCDLSSWLAECHDWMKEKNSRKQLCNYFGFCANGVILFQDRSALNRVYLYTNEEKSSLFQKLLRLDALIRRYPQLLKMIRELNSGQTKLCCEIFKSTLSEDDSVSADDLINGLFSNSGEEIPLANKEKSQKMEAFFSTRNHFPLRSGIVLQKITSLSKEQMELIFLLLPEKYCLGKTRGEMQKSCLEILRKGEFPAKISPFEKIDLDEEAKYQISCQAELFDYLRQLRPCLTPDTHFILREAIDLQLLSLEKGVEQAIFSNLSESLDLLSNTPEQFNLACIEEIKQTNELLASILPGFYPDCPSEVPGSVLFTALAAKARGVFFHAKYTFISISLTLQQWREYATSLGKLSEEVERGAFRKFFDVSCVDLTPLDQKYIGCQGILTCHFEGKIIVAVSDDVNASLDTQSPAYSYLRVCKKIAYYTSTEKRLNWFKGLMSQLENPVDELAGSCSSGISIFLNRELRENDPLLSPPVVSNEVQVLHEEFDSVRAHGLLGGMTINM